MAALCRYVQSRDVMSEEPNPQCFYEVLDAIRRRPAMYLGRKSLHDLYTWLAGYSMGRRWAGLAPSDEELEFGGFDAFVQDKYDWRDVGGWAAKIAYYHREDARALDEFFRLLDEFRESKRQGAATGGGAA